MSSNGMILAIGARGNNGNGTNSVRVCVFTWDSNSMDYVPRGLDMDGEAEWDNYGRSLAMSSNSMILSIGARGKNGNGPSSAHVRVFAWDGDANDYIQRGLDIDGDAQTDDSGGSLAMSSDGMI